jgi:death on curing protein
LGAVRYLTADDVLALTEYFLRTLGYSPPLLRADGRALLDSAVNRAQAAAYYAGADLASKAAALANGVALNHPFVDGNKRGAAITRDFDFRQSPCYRTVEPTCQA